MHSAGHLLVEQDRAGWPVDPKVGADTELAEVARSRIGGESRLQVAVAALGPGTHHLAVAELDLDVGHLDSAGTGWNVKADRAVGRALLRPGEDLSAWHVASAICVDTRPAVHAQRQIGAVDLYAIVVAAAHP